MNLNKKLDKIIDILYDEDQLKFKNIPTTELIIFGKKNYNLEWKEAELLLILDILQEEGYVVMYKGDFSENNVKMPAYSLTSKGIRLKQNGGFAFKRRIEWLTNFLIISASVVTILVGITTSIDLYNKYFISAKECNQTNNYREITNPKPMPEIITNDTDFKEGVNNKQTKKQINKDK